MSHTDEVPLEALVEAGVAFSVNTDDPAMFGTDLGIEHAIVNARGVSDAQLWRNVLQTCAADAALVQQMADW